LLKSDKRKIPTDSSRGEFLIFQQEEPMSGWDLWALSMKGDLKPFPVLRSRFNEVHGALSPEGNWLAYASDETGDEQVYVQSFTGAPTISGNGRHAAGKKRVSADGGFQPHWRSDGKELFYVSRDRKIVSVSIKTGPPFEVGTATPLFASTIQSRAAREYDVTQDGKRFVVTTTSDEQRPAPVTLVLNWTAALRE
jgi:Tol biopolymer transport system component